MWRPRNGSVATYGRESPGGGLRFKRNSLWMPVGSSMLIRPFATITLTRCKGNPWPTFRTPQFRKFRRCPATPSALSRPQSKAGLTSSGGYESRKPGAYDEALALFPEDVTGFLKESQPARWQALDALLGPKTAATVLDALSKELELKGTLHVLRHGFKCYGRTFRMAYFRPNTAMNPEAGRELRPKPADHRAPGRLYLRHEEGGRQEPPLRHRRDPDSQRHPRRYRRAEEPADRPARPPMRRASTRTNGTGGTFSSLLRSGHLSTSRWTRTRHG